MSPGTLDVVSRTGSVVGNGFVWIDGKEVRQEWVFQPSYEWPPYGVAEFRQSAVVYDGLVAWREACPGLWTDGCTFVRAIVERKDEIYPDPWRLACCAIIQAEHLAGIAFAEMTSGLSKVLNAGGMHEAFEVQKLEVSSPKILFEARETWLTNDGFQPPPLAPIRVGPYPMELFGRVGATRREILDEINRSGQYTRTTVHSIAYAGIPA